jgi:hypothetical protein
VLKSEDGQIFKGTFVEGKEHGEGMQISKDGVEKKGLWNMGAFVKWM